ncbi:hypothetical protein [Paenibacillus sp. PL91]|uniref:hypothetical protein n=1 Tax=Paenibacillus sp. PL91 TaxID=2729538 RepID=UPI00145E9357|nr:hypothetical protein [Paenibacillus sp. PL91]MBC9204959.1 hypothetical protein [Paenibacillus sp. PL91]
MHSEYIDRIVNLIFSQFANEATILQLVVTEGLINNILPGEYRIETISSVLYNPQDPMFTVMHENKRNMGQISFWEHNQILVEVLRFNEDQLLMRQSSISSTEEIDEIVYEYFAKLKS